MASKTETLPNLLTAEATANLLGIRYQTLSEWRCDGLYDLPFIRVGRRVMYRQDDVIAFIDRNECAHT